MAEAGYRVTEEAEVSPAKLTTGKQPSPWRKPLLFGLVGMAGLTLLYLGLVSLAEGWSHAVELLLEDACAGTCRATGES